MIADRTAAVLEQVAAEHARQDAKTSDQLDGGHWERCADYWMWEEP